MEEASAKVVSPEADELTNANVAIRCIEAVSLRWIDVFELCNVAKYK